MMVELCLVLPGESQKVLSSLELFLCFDLILGFEAGCLIILINELLQTIKVDGSLLVAGQSAEHSFSEIHERIYITQ